VTFALASAIPGRPVQVEPEIIARRVAGNPAYAVRYAHARAASGVRWALAFREAGSVPCSPADPGELALLDALSWLPERVAVAARRGRPDEFARYLAELAGVTVDVLSSVGHPGNAAAPGSDRLALAMAARAGLAAGLGLLEVSAPERL
jgi:arginyl-tRNA synthetase